MDGMPDTGGNYEGVLFYSNWAEEIGVAPAGFSRYALIQASSESRGNHLTGLGIPSRFPSFSSPNLKASAGAQQAESAAAVRGYDRNDWAKESPFPKNEWVFGSGGWYGFLPTTGVYAFRKSGLFASGELGPYAVFDKWASTVMLVDFVRRVRRSPQFQGMPEKHKNWLAIKRAGAGNKFIGDYKEIHSRSKAIRRRAEKYAASRGIPSSFLYRRVPEFDGWTDAESAFLNGPITPPGEPEPPDDSLEDMEDNPDFEPAFDESEDQS